MEIVVVNQSNINLLQFFIKNLGEASFSFRYHNSRTTDCIKNHLTTTLILENNEPVAYGHLDVENEIIWLGICVLPGFYGEGYGNIMMKELIDFAHRSNVFKINLTVDKQNTNAINLYERFNFLKDKEYENIYQYSLSLPSE